jgi:homoprotocatechuate degradation regulator HpaR
VRASTAQSGAASFRYPAFNRSLPMLLLAAREAVTQRFRHQAKAHGLTEQQWRVIRALAEVESLEIIALSAMCHIHSASLSRILPKLGKAGMISRCSNAADHRRVIVSLTPRGRLLLDETLPESRKIYQQLARDVGPERLERMYAMLEEFIVLLETRRPDEPDPAETFVRRASRKPARREPEK